MMFQSSKPVENEQNRTEQKNGQKQRKKSSTKWTNGKWTNNRSVGYAKIKTRINKKNKQNFMQTRTKWINKKQNKTEKDKKNTIENKLIRNWCTKYWKLQRVQPRKKVHKLTFDMHRCLAIFDVFQSSSSNEKEFFSFFFSFHSFWMNIIREEI